MVDEGRLQKPGEWIPLGSGDLPDPNLEEENVQGEFVSMVHLSL